MMVGYTPIPDRRCSGFWVTTCTATSGPRDARVVVIRLFGLLGSFRSSSTESAFASIFSLSNLRVRVLLLLVCPLRLHWPANLCSRDRVLRRSHVHLDVLGGQRVSRSGNPASIKQDLNIELVAPFVVGLDKPGFGRALAHHSSVHVGHRGCCPRPLRFSQISNERRVLDLRGTISRNRKNSPIKQQGWRPFRGTVPQTGGSRLSDTYLPYSISACKPYFN